MSTQAERLNALEIQAISLQSTISTLAGSGEVAEFSNLQESSVYDFTGRVDDFFGDQRVFQDRIDSVQGSLDQITPRTQNYSGAGAVTVTHNLGYFPLVHAYNSLGGVETFTVQHTTRNRFTITPTGGVGVVQYL